MGKLSQFINFTSNKLNFISIFSLSFLSDTLCALINNHLRQLAMKFPHTKFIKSLVQLCIPNFPESNLPAIFVYHEGELKKQILGSDSFGSSKLKQDGKFKLSIN